ncbi:MAG: AMP-binding protein [Saprospiraceae bacterium]
MNDLFLIIPATGEKYSYSFFLDHLQKQRCYSRFFNKNDLLGFYTNLILCILHEESEIEVNARFPAEENLISEFYGESRISSHTDLITMLEQSSATIFLQSSGTTGKSKKIEIPFLMLFNQSRRSEEYVNDVWVNAYHPSHMGGLKVFFQAFINGNVFVNLFGLKGKGIALAISENKVSHISATPTFYKMILPYLEYDLCMRRITLGGEIVSLKLITSLRKRFPLAKLNNVFASSETGTLMVSNSIYFKITGELINYLKVIKSELYVHRSLYRGSLNSEKEQWIATGDKIKMVNKHQFKFVGRKVDFVNVGGQRVNLNSVQQVVDQIPLVRRSNVFVRKNSITGSLICCELELNDTISVRELKYQLSKFLPSYQVPRIIKVVEQVSLTKTGKMKKSA